MFKLNDAGLWINLYTQVDRWQNIYYAKIKRLRNSKHIYCTDAQPEHLCPIPMKRKDPKAISQSAFYLKDWVRQQQQNGNPKLEERLRIHNKQSGKNKGTSKHIYVLPGINLLNMWCGKQALHQ